MEATVEGIQAALITLEELKLSRFSSSPYVSAVKHSLQQRPGLRTDLKRCPQYGHEELERQHGELGGGVFEGSQSVIVVIPSVALWGWRPPEGRRRAPSAAAAAVHGRRRREGGGIVPAHAPRRTAPSPRRGRAPHLVTAIASGAHASRRGEGDGDCVC